MCDGACNQGQSKEHEPMRGHEARGCKRERQQNEKRSETESDVKSDKGLQGSMPVLREAMAKGRADPAKG